MIDDVIIVTEKDYQRLNYILKDLDALEVEDLEIELERAKIVADSEIPRDVVTMNSQVEYCDLTSGKTNTVILVYPENASIEDKKVSILSPLGSALIGLREQQELNWRFPNGETHRLRIVKVHYQPEANGDWHL